MRRALFRIWRVINFASTIAWLISVGVGGVIAAAFSSVIDLSRPWDYVLIVSVGLIGMGVAAPMAQYAVASLRVHFQPPVVPADAEKSTVDASLRAIGQNVLQDLHEVGSKTRYLIENGSYASGLRFEFWSWTEGGADAFWQASAYSAAHKPVRDALGLAGIVSDLEQRRAGGAEADDLESLVQKVSAAEREVQRVIDGLSD